MNYYSNTTDEKALRIAYLIAACVQQTLTAAEHDELVRWVEESDDNLLLFQQLTNEKNIKAGITQMKMANERQVYQKIRSHLPFNK